MKIRSLTLFLFSLIALLPMASPADDADELMKAMKIKDQMLGGFEAMMPMIDQMAVQMGLDEAGKKELLAIYRDWYDEDIDHDKILKEVTALYRKAFTEDELRAMLAFFTSPVGQKVVMQSPQLMKEGAQIGMKEGQAKQEFLMKRLEPFMEEHLK